MLWSNGVLEPGHLGPVVEELLMDALERAEESVRPGHLFTALLEAPDPDCRVVLTTALHERVRLEELPNAIRAYCPQTETRAGLMGDREDFSPEVLDALDEMQVMLEGGNEDIPAAPLGELTPAHMWYALVGHPDADDRRWLGERLLDLERAREGFRRVISPGEGAPQLFAQPGGQLVLDQCNEGAITALTEAAQMAGRMGFDRLMPPHLFLALLLQPESSTEWSVRLAAPEGHGPEKVVGEIRRHLLAGREPSGAPLPLERDHLSDATKDILRAALRSKWVSGDEVVSEWHLAMALATIGDERLRAILGSAGIGISLEAVADRLNQYREQGHSEREPAPFTLPLQTGRCDDLTYLAKREELRPALHVDEVIERICRGLYRREANNVLIVGETGIGKRTAVRELARRAANGEVGFLSRKRFILIDAEDVPPDQARSSLSELISLLKGRNDIIPCVNGLGALLATDRAGSSGRPALRAALRGGLQMIAIMTRTAFAEHLSGDPQELRHFCVVEVDEPTEEEALAMLTQIREDLEAEYDLQIGPAAVERALRLAADCILSERLPAKAERVLRAACDGVAYEREQQTPDEAAEEDRSWSVTPETIVATVSAETGVTPSTLRGSAAETAYKSLLEGFVVGQPRAVEAVAQELRLIKQGLKKPTEPASVMLFVGLTGTGKTELAKAIAAVYSTSKSLQTYTMGNFSEAHSVSNLIGVPPGYVGYEQGGRLINQLNADPYSVLLFDEIDKAHPEVWRPMLNLFDEGWIVDRRNVKAWGTRAVMVLTSNAGAEMIARMMKQKSPQPEIERAVRDHLASLRDRQGTPRFPPEFLARIGCIVLFSPLGEEAMRGIVRLKLRGQAKRFEEMWGIELTWDEQVVDLIAGVSHRTNEASGGKEGGRIVDKNVNAMLLVPVMDLVNESLEEFEQAREIHVGVSAGNLTLSLRGLHRRSIEELTDICVSQVAAAASAAEASVREALATVSIAVSEWRQDVLDVCEEAEREALRASTAAVVERLEERVASIVNAASGSDTDLDAIALSVARELECFTRPGPEEEDA